MVEHVLEPWKEQEDRAPQTFISKGRWRQGL